MSLFDIAKEVREIAEMDEIPDDLGERLGSLDNDADRKIKSIVGTIRELEAEASGKREVAKQISEAARVAERKAERWREYLKVCLEMLQVHRWTTPYGDVSIQKSPPKAVLVADLCEVDEEFVRVKAEANLADALNHWKAFGEAPKGFAIATDNTHLRIK